MIHWKFAFSFLFCKIVDICDLLSNVGYLWQLSAIIDISSKIFDFFVIFYLNLYLCARILYSCLVYYFIMFHTDSLNLNHSLIIGTLYFLLLLSWHEIVSFFLTQLSNLRFLVLFKLFKDLFSLWICIGNISSRGWRGLIFLIDSLEVTHWI